MKKRLIRRLFDKLIYKPNGIHVFYITSKDILSHLSSTSKKIASGSKPEAILPYHFNKRATDVFLSSGSPVVALGSP